MAQLLAVGIAVNVGAFVVSTLPVDLLTSRQLVATLPLGAVLAGRTLGRYVVADRRLVAGGLALLAVFTVAFAVRATTARPGHPGTRRSSTRRTSRG